MTDAMRKAAALLLTVLWWLPAPAGGAEGVLPPARADLGTDFRVFHFEPGGPPEDNRDRDGNGWPDYWQKLVDDRNNPHLGANVRIVEDRTRAGRYAGAPGHVLQIPFDGTGVAVETRHPVRIDPEMAYEVTAYGRSQRLNKSVARLTLQWLRIQPDGDENLQGEHHLVVPPGQSDWPEFPLRLHVNKVPAGTTHLRLNLNVYPDPRYRGADRHGFLWVDDIAIRARPKIYMEPTFRDYLPRIVNDNPPPPFEFTINYRGLLDNIPAGERKGGIAKEYYRIIHLADIDGNAPRDRHGRLIKSAFARRRAIYPGTLDTYPEKITVALDKLGVYYLTVTLYGYKGERLTERTQVLGLWQPSMRRGTGMEEAAVTGGFGVVIDEVPFAILQEEGKLAELVERTGARYVKSRLWPGRGEKNDVQFFTAAMAEELGRMRRAGIRVTAMMEPPENVQGAQSLYSLMLNHPKSIAPYTDAVTATYDAYIENWQWGGDGEPSFSYGVDVKDSAEARALLAGKVSSPSQSFPVELFNPRLVLPPAEISFAAGLCVPPDYNEKQLLDRLIAVLPDYFTRFQVPEKRLYPPQWLLDASPVPEPVDETRPLERKLEEWLTCELPPAPADAHVPLTERQILGDMARKAVIARVCGLPRFYVKSLLSPTQGLARLDQDNHPIPLPALLGLRVLDEYLTGATYLGSFNLVNEHGNFPNYVFARADGKQAIAVVWYEGRGKEEAPLDFGGGYRLNVVDMQGNIRPLPGDSVFTVGRTPQIVTGMSVAYARTRMSINIKREPLLLMRMQEQTQYLTITNFYEHPINGDIMLSYAARGDSFIRENNWRVEPQKLTFTLPRPRHGVPQSLEMPFEVRPPRSSTLDEGKETGSKLASLKVTIMGEHSEKMRLLRPTTLSTDIHFSLRLLTSPNDPDKDIVQMLTRWIPGDREPHKAEIILRPFYRRGNDLDILLPSVVVPAYQKDDTETPPVAIEYRLPKTLRGQDIWVGFRQEDGTRFLNYNVDKLLGTGLE
ncbi:MAG: hypothetical protein J6333_12410 [Planctomycetes bacterium]|nr:hypothetical protein [Planctomycetota bacterium]